MYKSLFSPHGYHLSSLVNGFAKCSRYFDSWQQSIWHTVHCEEKSLRLVVLIDRQVDHDYTAFLKPFTRAFHPDFKRWIVKKKLDNVDQYWLKIPHDQWKWYILFKINRWICMNTVDHEVGRNVSRSFSIDFCPSFLNPRRNYAPEQMYHQLRPTTFRQIPNSSQTYIQLFGSCIVRWYRFAFRTHKIVLQQSWSMRSCWTATSCASSLKPYHRWSRAAVWRRLERASCT